MITVSSSRSVGNQLLLDVGQEDWPIHGTIDHHRSRHARDPQSADERRRLPMTVRELCRSRAGRAARGLGAGTAWWSLLFRR